MSKILVFGHQNPDTDAIGSSYAFAELSRLRGLDAEVVALGEVNEETAFALDYFGVTAPRVVTSAKAEGVDTVILTDHNEFQQSISDIRDVTIMGVVDHHRVANFETEAPLFTTLKSVGWVVGDLSSKVSEIKPDKSKPAVAFGNSRPSALN